MKANLWILFCTLAFAGCVENADPVQRNDGHNDRRSDSDASTASGSAGAGGVDGEGGEGGNVDAPVATPTPNQPVDNDGDGYTRTRETTVDCDDADPSVNPGADEVCDDSIDNNCDGDVDEGCDDDPDPEQNDNHAQNNDGNPPREHLLVIEVGRDVEQSAITFSWGYCSDVALARDCHDWHEDTSRVLWDTAVRQSINVNETGFVRFNASFYNDGVADVNGNHIVGEPNGWLAQRLTDERGVMVCADTARVRVWLDGTPFRDVLQVIVFGDGCSAALDIAELVDLLNN